MDSKIKKFEKQFTVSRPDLKIGDTVLVDTIIRDGDKQRVQKFQGIVIAMKGKGLSKTFTVRKISYGVGVEKIFPLYSTNISNIEILKHAKVKRSKLYYLRDRVGKAATYLKPGKALVKVENIVEEVSKQDELNELSEEVKVATK